MKKAKQLSNLR